MGYFQLSVVWGSLNCDCFSILNIIGKSPDLANLSAILKFFLFLSVQLSLFSSEYFSIAKLWHK